MSITRFPRTPERVAPRTPTRPSGASITTGATGTQIFTRYALQSESDFAGTVDNSPYNGFNTGETIFNNRPHRLDDLNAFSPRLVSQSKLDFNPFQYRPAAFGDGRGAPVLPGQRRVRYIHWRLQCRDAGLRPHCSRKRQSRSAARKTLGRPIRISVSRRGKHEFRWGGSFTYLRDNRTFGLYEESEQVLGNKIGERNR